MTEKLTPNPPNTNETKKMNSKLGLVLLHTIWYIAL
jgi:hypothetical protein